MWKLLSCLISVIPAFALAIDYAPWFSRDFEIEAQASFLYQTFRSLETSDGNIHYPSYDRFTTLSARTTVLGVIQGEVDVTCADTRHRRFGYDHASFTGSYLLMDDIIGDPLSLTCGITLSQVGREALSDRGSFHQGRFEGQAFLSFGKEISSGDRWVARGWGSCLIGFADRGSPWLQGMAVWERQYCDSHFLRLMTIARWGSDNHVLRGGHFKGYGYIQHRSVDLALRYSYRFDIWGTLNLSYARRLYARNFPQYVNIFEVSYLLPFGPGI